MRYLILSIALLLVVCCAEDYKLNHERAKIESQISQLRKYLERNEGSGMNLGLQWAQLGYIYQVKNVIP